MRRDGGVGDDFMRDVDPQPGTIFACSDAPDILCRLALRQKLLLAALMTVTTRIICVISSRLEGVV